MSPQTLLFPQLNIPSSSPRNPWYENVFAAWEKDVEEITVIQLTWLFTILGALKRRLKASLRQPRPEWQRISMDSVKNPPSSQSTICPKAFSIFYLFLFCWNLFYSSFLLDLSCWVDSWRVDLVSRGYISKKKHTRNWLPEVGLSP